MAKAKKEAPVDDPAQAQAGMRVENRVLAIADLTPHPRNYNWHAPSTVKKLSTSLQKHGQPRSIVVWLNPVDERYYIIAGHGVTQAAQSLNWLTIRADVLLNYPEHLALSYLVADNEHARDSDPDKAALALIIDEVSQYDSELLEAMSFDEGKFAALLAEVEAGIDSAGSSTGMDGGYGAGGGESYGGGDGGDNRSGDSGEPVDYQAMWQGMPEFEHDDKTAFKRLIVHFKSQKEVDDFSELVGQKIIDSTKFIWYPEQEIIRYGEVHES